MSFTWFGQKLKFFKEGESQTYVYHSCYGKMHAHLTMKDGNKERYFQNIDPENLVNLIGILLTDWIEGEMPEQEQDCDGIKFIEKPDYEFIYWIIQEISARLNISDKLLPFEKMYEYELASEEEKERLLKEIIQHEIDKVKAYRESVP